MQFHEVKYILNTLRVHILVRIARNLNFIVDSNKRRLIDEPRKPLFRQRCVPRRVDVALIRDRGDV